MHIFLIAYLGSYDAGTACDEALAQARATLPADITVQCMISLPPDPVSAPLRPQIRPDDLCSAPCTALRPLVRP